MILFKHLLLLGLSIAFLFFTACAGIGKPERDISSNSIQHFDLNNGFSVPEEFTRVKSVSFAEENQADRYLLYYPIDDIVEFEEGWLASGSKGEWGGVLYWLSREGDFHVLIKNNNNPSDVALFNGSVFITWSPFLPLAGGKSDLIRVQKTEGRLNVDKFSVDGGVKGFDRKPSGLWVNTETIRIIDASKVKIAYDKASYQLDIILNDFVPQKILSLDLQ